MIFWGSFCFTQIVVHPMPMPAFTGTIVEVYALPPWTGIKHLVGISITDVAVKNVFRHRTGDEIELRVVVIAA